MAFRVTEVFDGDTFRVSQNWRFSGLEGDVIRPNGYNTPEEGKQGYEDATRKLKELILDKEVELKNAIKILEGNRLLCDVFINEKNLADYFPEYKN